MSSSNKTFHLGLTMAGAVSAGCYTAGAMDYLFEVLDLWERAKQGEVDNLDQNLIPQHNVIIEAMGGASAGGMTTIISSLFALQGNIRPVKKIPDDPMSDQNLLYNSWIHLDDDKETTFNKLWNSSDLKNGLSSILNSKPIDSIAEKLINSSIKSNTNLKAQVQKLPKYVSKDLEIILSHTLLRGIALSVDFKTSIAKRDVNSPKHNTFEHYTVSHFKLNNGDPVDESKNLWLNPYEEKYAEILKLSTISTGAFPIGFAYRKFDSAQLNDEYIKAVTKRIILGEFGEENPDLKDEIELADSIKKFSSLTIDGGAINNEPFREVESILRAKFRNEGAKHQCYGLIMIDPFPDNDQNIPDYKEPKGLLEVIPTIIKTLWNQAKVKRKEMYEQYSSDFFKGVIYPSKHIINADDSYNERDKFPLLCSAFNAFGGFLDVKFRQHDFFLGRNNARNFVRFFGSLEYDPERNNVHPIHKSWTREMVEKFKIEKKGKMFLPIIPDLNLLIENKTPDEDRYKYTCSEKPKYNPQKLFDLNYKIANRFKEILNLLGDNVAKTTHQEYPISDKWLEANFGRNWFQRRWDSVKKIGIGIITKSAKNNIAESLSKNLIKMILKDLEKMNVLDEKK